MDDERHPLLRWHDARALDQAVSAATAPLRAEVEQLRQQIAELQTARAREVEQAAVRPMRGEAGWDPRDTADAVERALRQAAALDEERTRQHLAAPPGPSFDEARETCQETMARVEREADQRDREYEERQRREEAERAAAERQRRHAAQEAAMVAEEKALQARREALAASAAAGPPDSMGLSPADWLRRKRELGIG